MNKKTYLVIFLLVISSLIAISSSNLFNKEDIKLNEIKSSYENSTTKIYNDFYVEYLTDEEVIEEIMLIEEVSKDEAKLIFERDFISEKDSEFFRNVRLTKLLMLTDGIRVYRPNISYIITTSEDDDSKEIVELNYIKMNLDDGNFTCNFMGDIYVDLEDKNTIYTDIGGDFYRNGYQISIGENISPKGAYTNLRVELPREQIKHYSDWFRYKYDINIIYN